MDQLQTLLQFLVTDASTVAHLSYILDHLSPSCLAPSPHLQRWVVRVTSLMHSKDPAARWAAICIAHRMSFLSTPLLVDNAQSWIGIVFPFLSKPEPVPILRASMRYLSLVLCTAAHNLEFQRQVITPVVPKVSSALLAIAEKYNNQDIKAQSIHILARLIPLYPSPHKALSQRLFTLCNQVFSGSVYHTTACLLDATVKLYSLLHFLGGKVGGAHLWRNCVDETLRFCWSAWLALRTTFPTSMQLSHQAVGFLRLPDGKQLNPALHADAATDDPLATVALNLDRLKHGVSAIGALLKAPLSRPVILPTGHLSTFGWCLLTSTSDDEGQMHFDPHVRASESAVAPQILMQACRLLSCLAETTQGLLAPQIPKLIMIISSHLENKNPMSLNCSFLQCAHRLLYFCPVVGATVGINRLLKGTILILSPLYLHQPRTEKISAAINRSTASKKRRREFEVDNVLSTANITVIATTEECDTLIAALDVVDQCMLNVELAPSTRSLANRVLLSILLSLNSMPPSSLSSDLSFHQRVIKKVREISIQSALGTSHALGKGTGLLLRALSFENLTPRDKIYSHVDLLLHPRRPPFVRTLPFVESLSLSSVEESPEERATRHSLDLGFSSGDIHPVACERQDYSDPAGPGSTVPDPQTNSVDLLRGRGSIELQPQTTSNATGDFQMEATTQSIVPLPPPQAMPGILVKPPSSISEMGSTQTVYAAPMLVDESDHEEVPAIDLGSDSDD